MEALMYYSSADQQISPNKNYFKTSKNHGSLIPRFSDDFAPAAGYFQAGLLHAPVPNHHPPFLSQSFPVFSVHRNQQPPLLPLPVSNFSQIKTLSCPPNYGRNNNNNNNNKSRNREQSLTPKKSPKQISKSPKKEEKLSKSRKGDIVVISSNNIPLGPDPEKLPKDVAFSSKGCVDDVAEKDKFSGSVVFTLSPPPSSLPLPTFSLRPKLSCNAEAAAGIDTGATDNLCRLLRLR